MSSIKVLCIKQQATSLYQRSSATGVSRAQHYWRVKLGLWKPLGRALSRCGTARVNGEDDSHGSPTTHVHEVDTGDRLGAARRMDDIVRPPRDSLVRDSLRIPLRGDAVIATTRSTHATRMRGSLYRDRPVRSRHLPSDRGQNTRDAERRYGRAPSTTTPCVRACVHFRTFALPRACVAQRSHDHDAF